MSVRHTRIPAAAVLVVGLFAGWFLSLLRPAQLRAGGSDRLDETIVTTGAVLVQFDQATKATIPLDALYILNCKTCRLVATLPTYRQTTSSTTIIESFVERDLAADFKLNPNAGPRPQFLMTTGSLGQFMGGWSPLYVIETTSHQIAVYRLNMQGRPGKSSRAKFELLQVRPYPVGRS
jgi:hypothetical protein